MTETSVPITIAKQLGGTNKLAAMIGAKDFLTAPDQLSFRFGGRAKNRANFVEITLEANDTYTVRFAQIGRAPKFDVTERGTTSMIYADSLREHFEGATGFCLSL